MSRHRRFLLSAVIFVALVFFSRNHCPDHNARLGHDTANENTLADALLLTEWASVDTEPLSALQRQILGDILEESELTEGHSLDTTVLRQASVVLARQPWVRRICEVGFNAGMSAVLWLSASSPGTELISFDIMQKPYSVRAKLRVETFAASRGRRFLLVEGPSNRTMAAFSRANPATKCDLVVIDGGHDYDSAMSDIDAGLQLANPARHLLIVDDANCDAAHCVDAALDEQRRRGVLRSVPVAVAEHFAPVTRFYHRGMALLRYSNVPSFQQAHYVDLLRLSGGDWFAKSSRGRHTEHALSFLEATLKQCTVCLVSPSSKATSEMKKLWEAPTRNVVVFEGSDAAELVAKMRDFATFAGKGTRCHVTAFKGLVEDFAAPERLMQVMKAAFYLTPLRRSEPRLFALHDALRSSVSEALISIRQLQLIHATLVHFGSTSTEPDDHLALLEWA